MSRNLVKVLLPTRRRIEVQKIADKAFHGVMQAIFYGCVPRIVRDVSLERIEHTVGNRQVESNLCHVAPPPLYRMCQFAPSETISLDSYCAASTTVVAPSMVSAPLPSMVTVLAEASVFLI